MIPRATYRLQFHGGFVFADAAAIIPYLAQLGISHLYASPWLHARAGSTHGYDIIDHTAFNPELGGAAGFEALHEALRAQGMCQIVDFVPNHMGIAQGENHWWLDVLEWGRASPYAAWFDIEWQPPDPALHDKVLLPFLGDHYGAVLERGELQPRFDPTTGTFSVWYFDNHFPLAPHTWADLLRAGAGSADAGQEVRQALARLARLAEHLRIRAGTAAQSAAHVRDQACMLARRLAAQSSLHPCLHAGAARYAPTPDDATAQCALHRLLERQAYRLAYWRVATDEINFRRFFDINQLAALRVENPQVFAHIHTLVARLLAEDKLDGLRIDHIDGLADPAQYCRRLQRLVPRPFYLVIEKILARHEALRTSWPIAGTTGYDFLAQLTGLLVDPRSQGALDRIYRRFTGITAGFDEVLLASKRQIVRNRLGGELHALAHGLQQIARHHVRTRDYTLHGFTRALEEVVIAFPVYRTYIDEQGASADDRRDIAWAVAQARKRWRRPGGDIFDFIEAVLTSDLAASHTYGRSRVLHLAMKFQQYSAPVMAKGCEDTAMYRYYRLAALDEVGSDPRQFGISVSAFHHANQERARRWPHAMLASATHDTKRGEDVRARLAALSAIAPAWGRAVARWARLNQAWKSVADDRPAPDRNDEYLLYQTLIGAWPLELTGTWRDDVAGQFKERVQAYMIKAIREAKLHSSWHDPDDRYESATSDFIEHLFNRNTGRLFLDTFLPLQRRIAQLGMRNSLVQLTLKLTCPGVPDIYQGCELWDFNLVDPDNRRAVDFDVRAQRLAQVKAWDEMTADHRRQQLSRWHADWHDGAIKLHILRQLLALRTLRPRLFAEGEYHPLELIDIADDRAIAFERSCADERIIVIALLHTDQPGTIVEGLSRALATSPSPHGFVELLTGACHDASLSSSSAPLLAQLPVAVLQPKPDGARRSQPHR